MSSLQDGPLHAAIWRPVLPGAEDHEASDERRRPVLQEQRADRPRRAGE